MTIKWFDTKEKEGSASIYSSSIILNTIASVPFEFAYRVQVGLDEKNNIVIRPLPKERVIRGDLDEYSLQKISITKSYSRIASTAIIKKISEATGLAFSEIPMKFSTEWNEDDDVLIIKTGGQK